MDAEITTVNKTPEEKSKKHSDNFSTLSLKNNLGYYYMLPVNAYM